MPETRQRGLLLNLLISMRPYQWTKNALLFAGLIFSHNYLNPQLALRAVAGFAIFCLISGAIYIVNDVIDMEADRVHPRKRRRPVASGALKRGPAIVFAVILAVLSLGLAFSLSPPFGMTALSYLVITVAYSTFFKHIAVVDLILLALGFVLRAIAGVVVIRVADSASPVVPMTPWFVICVFFLAFFIAVCKRRHERVAIEEAEEHRRVLAEYSPEFLDQLIAVSTSATIISYSLYLIAGSQSPSVIPGDEHLSIIATLPFVIYGIARYLQLVYRRSEGGEPERLVLKDKPLLINTIIWLILIVLLHRK